MPHEASGFRKAPEVVGADIVLVHFGLAVPCGDRLDRLTDAGPGIKLAHDGKTRRLR